MIGSIGHLTRLMRAGFLLAREGALGLVEPSLIPPAMRLPLRLGRLMERRNLKGTEGARLVAAMTRLGPSYVKMGQFLATRPDIVGVSVARDLEALQDRVPSVPRDVAVKQVEAALGAPIGELFDTFGDAVAAASIAQVHRARTRDGRDVAVKVLKPGVRESFARDLSAMRAGARIAERQSAEARRLRFVEVVETLARSVAVEMDLRLEAASMSELADNTRGDRSFRVPAPDWERTSRDVMSSGWVTAIPLHDIAAIDAAGHDRPRLASLVIQSFLRQAIRDGFFHADMHQGNLFVDARGRLVAVDFGIMGRLGLKERRFLAEILYGFIKRDYDRVAQVHFDAGYVPAHHSVADFASALRAVGEPIHDRRADQISMAKLLSLLFEITGLFDMRTRTELVMLQKTMVVVEGVARSLDPRVDLWSTAEPVVRDWITHNLGPAGKLEDAGRGLAALVERAGHLPQLLARAERVTADLETSLAGGMRLSAESIEAIGRAEARRARWGHAALWAIAAILLVIAWRLS